MPKETYQQKKIKRRLVRVWNSTRGREYYWVKSINPETYHGKPCNQYSPRGHQRAEDLAERRSKLNNIRVEIYWACGPYGTNKVNLLDDWKLYKVYENGMEIKIEDDKQMLNRKE